MDLLFDPFGGQWEDLRDAAVLAERSGFDGLWLYDHLAGSVHGASHVLECWTVLSAVAAAVPRLMVGSLVLNVANRDAGTLAVMAATLQEVSAGRLLLGVGAGGGVGTPYAAEQVALGRAVPGDASRRAQVEATIATLRQVWAGATGGCGRLPAAGSAAADHRRRLRPEDGRVGRSRRRRDQRACRAVAGASDRHCTRGPRPQRARP